MLLSDMEDFQAELSQTGKFVLCNQDLIGYA